MPPLQTTFPQFISNGIRGKRVNTEEWNGITGIPDAANILPGMPVKMDDSGDQSITEYDGSGRFRGIAELEQGIDYNDDDTYKIGYNVAVLTVGVIWVETSEAVDAGEAAYWDPSANKWTGAATASVAVPGAEFDSTLADAGLAKVRLVTVPGLTVS